MIQQIAGGSPRPWERGVLWCGALGARRVPEAPRKRDAMMPGPYVFEIFLECESLERKRRAAPAPPHTPFPPINNPKCHFKGHQEPGTGATEVGGPPHTTPLPQATLHK